MPERPAGCCAQKGTVPFSFPCVTSIVLQFFWTEPYVLSFVLQRLQTRKRYAWTNGSAQSSYPRFSVLSAPTGHLAVSLTPPRMEMIMGVAYPISGSPLQDRRINNCRNSRVAITLRVMIADKNGTGIGSAILTVAASPRACPWMDQIAGRCRFPDLHEFASWSHRRARLAPALRISRTPTSLPRG